MHIAVFLQYYHTPDCPTAARPYALVKRLAQEHEVTLLTTHAWEENRLAHRYSWVPDGVRLVRFDVPYNNEMGPFDRLCTFAHYALRSIGYALRMPRPDLILGSSTPLTTAVAAGVVATVRRIPWIFEVRDLWPDFPIQMGVVRSTVLQRLLYALERCLYRSAAHVVALSPDMERHVRTVAPSSNVSTMVYGTDRRLLRNRPDPNQLRRRLSLDRPHVVLYAGTLGRANAIPTLLDAARRLADRDDVLIGFAGTGYHEDTVRRAAHRHEHIRLLDPLPYPEALSLFSVADVSLVSFRDRPVLAANSPGKFYDSLAVGTPVVVTNPGWTQRFVDRHQCGWSVPPESPIALANQLRALLDAPDRLATAGRRGRTVARQKFDRAAIMDEYAALVDAIGHS